MTLSKFRTLIDDEWPLSHGDFSKVPSPTSQRPLIHALNLLDRLLPGSKPILASCTADDPDPEYPTLDIRIPISKLLAVATPDDIINLARCGVRYNRYDKKLYIPIPL